MSLSCRARHSARSRAITPGGSNVCSFANTLATSLWTETGVAAYAAAAPYALALVLLAVLPTLWLMRAQGRFTATEDL